jgi:RNA polymerase sigma-70 factor (ECF subfamily)
VAASVMPDRARLALRELLAEQVGEAASGAFPFLAPRCDRVVAAVMAKIAPPR